MSHMRVIDPKGGSDQSGLRDQNARLILSYIRRHGAMPSAEIARRSGLSAQTVSNIMRNLEAEGLVQREAALKGRVGKPSVPMALKPDGVHGLGLSIGRRSLELVLVDFKGCQLDAEVATYSFPTCTGVLAFVGDTLPRLLARNDVPLKNVAGLGVARPNRIWEWAEFIDASEGAMDHWKSVDLESELMALTGLDVVTENDATAACVAEHLLGRGHDLEDFAYFFLGAFVGGGLVLDGKVISGRNCNAAALGPLPVPDGTGGVRQLLDVASLHVLESALTARSLDADDLRAKQEDCQDFEPMLSDWIATTGYNLAIASVAIASVVEVEAILIEGAFPAAVRARLTQATEDAFGRLKITGIEIPRIEPAVVGRRARSVGAALLPIHAGYFVN